MCVLSCSNLFYSVNGDGEALNVVCRCVGGVQGYAMCLLKQICVYRKRGWRNIGVYREEGGEMDGCSGMYVGCTGYT